MNGEKRGLSMHNTRSQALPQRLVGTVMAGALLVGGGSVAHGALTTPVGTVPSVSRKKERQSCS
jgi:hypothetical protein